MKCNFEKRSGVFLYRNTQKRVPYQKVSYCRKLYLFVKAKYQNGHSMEPACYLEKTSIRQPLSHNLPSSLSYFKMSQLQAKHAKCLLLVAKTSNLTVNLLPYWLSHHKIHTLKTSAVLQLQIYSIYM